MGAKLLCAQLEGASLKNCNFEDPAGSRANMEGMKILLILSSHILSLKSCGLSKKCVIIVFMVRQISMLLLVHTMHRKVPSTEESCFII